MQLRVIVHSTLLARVLRPEGKEPTATLFLDSDSARALARRGFSIGSHTISHPVLVHEATPAQYYELAESRRSLAELLGVRIQSLAYPNGNYCNDTLAAAHDAGYRSG